MSAGLLAPPLTLGTAGHIDHGKTTLVHALTGTDTDRLPEERRRGISIELGFALMQLPSGRAVSVVDVPGHERFVRTMVAGATGVDLFLLVVAADDGVMPQTVEHAEVLRALGVNRGVVAITKSDLCAPDPAAADCAELLAPWAQAEIVACSARSGEGVADVAAALERAAATLPGRVQPQGDVVLHVDRAFMVHGSGTVVTGTLWGGRVARGSRLVLLPRQRAVRVRSVQVHGDSCEYADAGQRVALNLVGVDSGEVARGDVVASADACTPTYILDARLTLRGVGGSVRATIHHGTRESPGRLVALGGDWWQLRVSRPLLARAGDHVVARAIAPPGTLGGGVIIDPRARHHGPGNAPLELLDRLEHGELPPAGPVPSERDRARSHSRVTAAPTLSPEALALEARLRDCGIEPPNDADLGEQASELPALVAAGRVVRVGRSMHAHVDAIARVRQVVVERLERDGTITAAELRDELGTSRKYALALLEHLDASRVTLRRADDVRLLRRRHAER